MLNGHSQKDRKLSLNLQYFRPSFSYHLSLRSLFCLFLSGRFTLVLLYHQRQTINLKLLVVNKVKGPNSQTIRTILSQHFTRLLMEVSKGAKFRNQYDHVPHLTQDTNGKLTNSQLDTTNESQEVSTFPAGDTIGTYKQTRIKA